MLLKRLNFQLKELNLFREGQYGFKKGDSAAPALTLITERIVLGFNNNKAN
jgi:hypothetical protein